MSKPLNEMTTPELTAELELAETARQAAKARGREIQVALRARLAAEHAAYHGLTPAAYAEAKQAAAEEGRSLASVLGAVRKSRAVQVAKATTASVGTEAKGTA